jgi:uncharacterized protein with FMN-binding domain
MITAAASRSVRAGVAVVGMAGALTLAGCAGTTDDSAPKSDSGSTGTGSGSTDTGSSGSTGAGSYADGTYTAEGAYATPESVETITVTVTLEGDVITAVDVIGDPQKHESAEYQARFIGGIADVVVGEDIDDVSVSRVAGSSLTSKGFNQAIEAIKADAAA